LFVWAMGNAILKETGMNAMQGDVLAPCGLYCAICVDYVVNKVCHGCGCDCGECAGTAHAESCHIAQCAAKQGFETCAECDDLPCTDLILFAYHPLVQHHLPVIEVLRRAQKVGKERLLAELRAALADGETRMQWAFGEEDGERRRARYREWRSALRDTAPDAPSSDS
jgi:hypothetical protein